MPADALEKMRDAVREQHSADELQDVDVPTPSSALSGRLHFMRRPRKYPLFVVFCLMVAVSPCSDVFWGSGCLED